MRRGRVARPNTIESQQQRYTRYGDSLLSPLYLAIIRDLVSYNVSTRDDVDVYSRASRALLSKLSAIVIIIITDAYYRYIPLGRIIIRAIISLLIVLIINYIRFSKLGIKIRR